MTSFWGKSSFFLAFAQDLDYRNLERVMKWCQSVSHFPCCAPGLHSPPDTQCICQLLLRAGWDCQFKLWPTANYQAQYPWAVIDLTQGKINTPRKTPLLGYRAPAAAHSPLQGKVMLTSLLTVSSIPRKEIGFPVQQQAQQTKTTLSWP